MAKSYFITATDTAAGKTTISHALLKLAKQQNLTTLGIKPIASGCDLTANGLINDDAMRLLSASSLTVSYTDVNPVALQPAIAPHIALQQLNQKCTVKSLAEHCNVLLDRQADLTIIEGAGGWRVPLNNQEFISDLVMQLNIAVILVVPMKLGCINHALLTAESINKDGLHLTGWIANCVNRPMECYYENIETLINVLEAPCLGEIPYITDGNLNKVPDYLDIKQII
jgi:dethiobiotin synthetase